MERHTMEISGLKHHRVDVIFVEGERLRYVVEAVDGEDSTLDYGDSYPCLEEAVSVAIEADREKELELAK